MPAVMRASAVVERSGIPAVAIGAEGFGPMGRVISRALGIPHVPIVLYPGVILTDTSEVFRQKVRGVVAKCVVEALQGRAERTPPPVAATEGEPGPRDVVISGNLDEIQEVFTERLWTDGLPIVPPTLVRIERFLKWTDRDPNEVIGILGPERRQATVWNVAVNGVMAGCRPEYLPVLLAVVECIADPLFRVEDAGSTPGWEPLVVLSGALVHQLDFNFGTGVMRVGRQANTSIGRFVRLYLRNVPGLRIPPGSTDQGAIAGSFNVVLAEDEDATTAAGWSPYRVDRGFDSGVSLVSVQSVVSISAPIYTGGNSAQDHLETLALLFGNAMGPWSLFGVANDAWYPLLVLGPSVAQALAGYGVDKDALRRYLYENVSISAGVMERYAWQVGRTSFSLAELVREGKAPQAYAVSNDPDRLVPMFLNPESIGIVVAGSRARNQSRAYVGNHSQGTPAARVVQLPAAWDSLMANRRRRRPPG